MSTEPGVKVNRIQTKHKVAQRPSYFADGLPGQAPLLPSNTNSSSGAKDHSYSYEGTRKHYTPQTSETSLFKPGRRTLTSTKSQDHAHSGIRKITPNPALECHRPEQRHLLSHASKSGYDDAEYSIEKALNRKHTVLLPSGAKARNFISTELTLPVAFGQKKKNVGGIQQSRNNIPVSNLGDKLYASVEYSPGFYKEFNGSYSRVGGVHGNGGTHHSNALQSQSTSSGGGNGGAFDRTKYTNTMNRGDTVNFRPRLSYEERMGMKELQEDIDGVFELTNSKGNSEGGDEGEEKVESWENRTGLYVWKSRGVRDREEKENENKVESYDLKGEDGKK